jgi:hypothetical protein
MLVVQIGLWGLAALGVLAFIVGPAILCGMEAYDALFPAVTSPTKKTSLPVPSLPSPSIKTLGYRSRYSRLIRP